MKIQDFDYFKPIQDVDGQNPLAAAEDFDIETHVTDAESVNPPDQNGLSGLACQNTFQGNNCIPVTSRGTCQSLTILCCGIPG